MKKITLSLILSLSIVSVIASTNVKGGIYSNTTWTAANSPYIVDSSIVIFQGITLTIQPGVTVEFNNGMEIEARGNIYANGTATDSIIFTSSSGTPKVGIYTGISMSSGLPDTTSFSYCRFSYASSGIYSPYNLPCYISHCKFTSDYNGINNVSQGTIDNCSFTYDTVGIAQANERSISNCLFMYNGTAIEQPNQCSITHCTISKNNYGLMDMMQGSLIYSTIDSNRAYGIENGGDTISNCDISYNGTGISTDEAVIIFNTISNNTNYGIMSYSNTITCNSICNNKPYNIVTSGDANSSVENNYWCLQDSASIQSTIYDGYVNLNLGLVYFIPFDTAPCASLPTGIAQLPSLPGFDIYPNPVKDELFITLHSAINGMATFSNVLGQEVYSTKISGDNGSIQKIDTGNLPEGVYLLRIESNGQALTKKVMKI
ncbi:MAG: T9SS type A sorting domain-containing protein [Bacteroidia bacterium]